MNENLEKPGERSSAETRIALFKGKEIRKAIHNNEWWFVIEDVTAVLTDSMQPKGYIKDMRRRNAELAKGWGQIATPLSSHTAGGVPLLMPRDIENSALF
ncbi:MAG: hypothetical protein NT166_12205 [Candidatus Aminicenantes bacterium]|nr:hypothetical protein [Candidatus Aminicenantes bacterium]